MEFRESISLASSSLRTNKLRSILTLLGIIIGIMAVVIIMTLGRGLQNQVLSGLEDIGASQHVVFISEQPQEDDQTDEQAQNQFTPPVEDEKNMVSLEQLQEIKDDFGPRVLGVNIDVSMGGEAELGDKVTSADVNPALAESLEMDNVKIEYGRGITQQDIDSQRPVAVVSLELVDALFDGDAEGALGKRFDLSVASTGVFTIIGVTEAQEKSSESFGQMQSNAKVYIPVSTTDRIDEKVEYVNYFMVRTTGDEDPSAFRDELQAYLDRWYAKNDEAQVEVLDMQSALAEFTAIFGIISSVLAAIGGISLLVGGIGVMNIMLITVTERTREIGVRKALGATRRDIRTQFIVEAVMVCLLGGVIGVLLGGIIGVIGSGFLGMAGGGSYGPVAFPPISAVLFSLLFSMATGIFFGAYPANKAAKMQPIDALRYE